MSPSKITAHSLITPNNCRRKEFPNFTHENQYSTRLNQGSHYSKNGEANLILMLISRPSLGDKPIKLKKTKLRIFNIKVKTTIGAEQSKSEEQTSSLTTTEMVYRNI